MDRLPALIPALLAVGIGCGDSGSKSSSKASRSRVNAVVAKKGEGPKIEEFCEVTAAPGDARAFAFPELGAGTPPEGGSWKWINVWATWCKPCIEELPLMQRWNKRLADDGVDAQLVYLSVDEDDATVSTFRETHTEVPADGLRIADAEGLGAWLATLGLDASSVLPIHLFVDENDKLRCVRMGGVSASDYDMIRRVLSQSS